MPNVERTTSWQQIQQGVKETERLIAREEYNLVVTGTRQVLEYIIRCMVERTCVVEGDLSDTMGRLYESQRIGKTTKDSYHTVHILGNKTVHEGDDTTYDANQIFQLLTQEVYVFANEFARGSGGRPVRTSSTVRNTSGRPTPRQGTGGSRSASGGNDQKVPTRSTRSGPFHQDEPRKRRRRVSPAAYILRLLIPMLLVILLTVVIRVFTSDKGKDANKTTTVPTVTTAPVGPAPAIPPEPEIEPETEPPVETYRTKGSSVNVRSGPFTSGRTLVQPGGGTEMVYVKQYNNDWAVTNYDGQGAYVSSKCIEKVGPVAPTGGETEGSETQTAN